MNLVSKKEQSMNDEQRAQLAKRISPAVSPIVVARLKTVFMKLENQLNAFIRSRRLDPLNLPNYKVQQVFVEDNCVTIITDTLHFVCVSDRDYDGGVSTVSCPDIEDAFIMDILSEEQYLDYKEAQRSYIGQRDAESLKARINDLVCQAGPDIIRGYLNELNQ